MRAALLRAWLLMFTMLGCSSRHAEEITRQEILSDLRKNSPTLHLRVLKSLPDRELPQLDVHFSSRAPHNPWLFGHLLARYGTRNVIAEVRSTYDAGHLKWGCDPKLPFLAYFLRVSPAEGESLLRTALTEREGNGCYHSMLSGLSTIFASPRLEPVAINALDDPDPEVAADAALVLSRYGSVSAEAHLWSRLERWTLEWRPRSREPYGGPQTDHGGEFWQLRLGDSLEGALATAQSWYLDDSRRQRLYDLCWTSPCRERYGSIRRTPPATRVRVSQLMYGEPTFEVAWYNPGSADRFRQKVSQFPKGTVFGWCTDREGAGELNEKQTLAARKQAKDIIEVQGFRFIADPPYGTCFTDKEP